MLAKEGSSIGQIRLVLVLLIGLALVIFVFQNREPVQTRFLTLEATMPRAAVLLITAAIGFLAGLLVPRLLGGKR